ncbi:MAG: hypothetical protein QXI11_02135 [Thermoproteota archaeon]
MKSEEAFQRLIMLSAYVPKAREALLARNRKMSFNWRRLIAYLFLSEYGIIN